MTKGERDAFDERARKALDPIYDAINDAVQKGEKLETVFLSGKFAALKGRKKMSYKTRKCRNCGEDVVVGGMMTIAKKAQDQLLRITHNEMRLSRMNGFDGASYDWNEDGDMVPEGVLCFGDYPGQMEAIRNAVIDFFERCYAKRM